ncbi:hypothetical protein I3842_10G141100 [Carya illinoinensis]|uniref:Uncharacterized protein n=1 Tax=Carya illinoinensis TaxID=32201 RepID=A0A922DZB6_CARIL|nr:hypothetical protein I3842_10G141100 [Carya illinoinensis]KAG6692969.1 hypothetical protein I3842_10G141100 [Carya illinoinensis]KAG6692970.1 hypothetical protein I3842_10G141100 [Carya illinoinensis]
MLFLSPPPPRFLRLLCSLSPFLFLNVSSSSLSLHFFISLSFLASHTATVTYKLSRASSSPSHTATVTYKSLRAPPLNPTNTNNTTNDHKPTKTKKKSNGLVPSHDNTMGSIVGSATMGSTARPSLSLSSFKAMNRWDLPCHKHVEARWHRCLVGCM